jgi:hypothetical protein
MGRRGCQMKSWRIVRRAGGPAFRVFPSHSGALGACRIKISAHFLRIQMPQVMGPACLLVMGRPASLRASLI